MGDAARVQQIIWNLLSNAIKFTPQQGQVEIRLTSQGMHAEIVVCDSGQGIEPEFLPYIFDRFQQADGSSTREVGGLGLGLSIVKQLVELHGGSVEAASGGKGAGATFTVRLPLPPLRPRIAAETPPSRPVGRQRRAAHARRHHGAGG